MAVIAYCGLPRHGKSYGAVENQLLPALRAGRHVVTNIPLHEDVIRAKCTKNGTITAFPTAEVKRDPSKLFDYVTHGCVFIVDELWDIIPATTKAAKVPQEWKTLFAEHGHRVDAAGNAISIVIITQNLGQVAAFFRDLVEQTNIVCKLLKLGFSGKYRVDIYSGKVSGYSGPKDRMVRQIFGSYKKEVYQFYKSHTMSESETAGANEASMDQRGVFWKRPAIMFGLPAMLIFGLFGLRNAWGFFQPKEKLEAAPLERAENPRSIERPYRAIAPVARATGRISGLWIVAGAMDQSRVFIERNGVTEVIPFMAARCLQRSIGGYECTWDGVRYVEAYGARPKATLPPLVEYIGEKNADRAT